jgi:hypothetical protein
MKYRVWDDAERFYDTDYFVKQDGTVHHPDKFNHRYTIVEEFTENFDNKHNPIYVGDVLRIAGFKNPDGSDIETMYLIVTKEETNHPMGKFVMRNKFKNEDGWGSMTMIGSSILCEIVGNIHENMNEDWNYVP